jgi:hypothetical protein
VSLCRVFRAASKAIIYNPTCRVLFQKQACHSYTLLPVCGYPHPEVFWQAFHLFFEKINESIALLPTVILELLVVFNNQFNSVNEIYRSCFSLKKLTNSLITCSLNDF